MFCGFFVDMDSVGRSGWSVEADGRDKIERCERCGDAEKITMKGN